MAEEDPLPPFTLLTDRATDTDGLGRAAFQVTLRGVVEQVQTPTSIAVYGGWGTGKTSALLAAREALKKRHWPTVWFDPWAYEQRGDVLLALMHALSKSFRRDAALWDRTKNLIKGATKTLLSLSARAGVMWLTGGLGGDAKAFADMAKIKPEDFAQHFDQWVQYQDEVDHLSRSFEALGREAARHAAVEGARLVIFLDDLDRCLPDTVVRLIEGVKLLLCGGASTDGAPSDAPVIFLFALDRRVVGEAILSRYPHSTAYTGENYLEKVFDLALEVPTVGRLAIDRIVSTTIDAGPLGGWLDEILPDGAAHLKLVLDRPSFAVPRVIKRTINRLLVLLSDPERRDRLRRVSSPDQKRRFIAWACAAERYRTFRTFYLTAVPKDVDRVRNGVGSDLTRELRHLNDTPHLRQFVSARIGKGGLGVDQTVQNGDRETTISAVSDAPQTIRDFDDLMREAGL